MNIKHGLSFLTLSTFALFAMGTSKAQEDPAGASSASAPGGASLPKLKGSCDLIEKIGLCTEFDSSLASISCDLLASMSEAGKDRWKKETVCPRTDKLLGTCLLTRKDSKEMNYYYHPTKNLADAKSECSDTAPLANKDTKYEWKQMPGAEKLGADPAASASGAPSADPAGSASAATTAATTAKPTGVTTAKPTGTTTAAASAKPAASASAKPAASASAKPAASASAKPAATGSAKPK